MQGGTRDLRSRKGSWEHAVGVAVSFFSQVKCPQGGPVREDGGGGGRKQKREREKEPRTKKIKVGKGALEKIKIHPKHIQGKFSSWVRGEESTWEKRF